MATPRELKEAERIKQQQRDIIGELQALAGDIERCERTIVSLKNELEQVNARHAGRATTQHDIAYLEDLLACAKRKLAWEKQMASVQKRTPELMQRIEQLVNHPQSSPDEQMRAGMMEAITRVQAAMKRLNDAKL